MQIGIEGFIEERAFGGIEFLREQGFSRVANLMGGIDQWAVAVDPSLPRY